MALKYKIEIPLITKKDILWNVQKIDVIWINQMYTWWHISGRKWKRLTPEAVKYKNYLKSKVDEFRITEKWKRDYDLKEQLFYTVTFYLNIVKTKENVIDERYVRDVDNLLKPLQDSFESDWEQKRIWANDKQVRCLLATIEYESENPRIEVHLYNYDKEKVRDLFTYIEKTF